MPRKLSCLIPYKDEIMILRETIPPTSYAEIAEILKKNHQVSISKATIHSFLKALIRGYKPCELTKRIRQAEAEAARPAQPASATPATPAASEISPQVKELNVPISEKHILTLKPEEERAARVAKIEAEEAHRRKQLGNN